MTDATPRAPIRRLFHAGHGKLSSELEVHDVVVPDGE
jgi:hypothetical protein